MVYKINAMFAAVIGVCLILGCESPSPQVSETADFLARLRQLREDVDLPETNPVETYAQISGRIQNTQAQEVKVAYHAHQFTWALEAKKIRLDDEGAFHIALKVPDPSPIVYLTYGGQKHRLYLEPQDSVHISMDTLHPHEVHFSGRGAQNNAYLVEVDSEFPERVVINYKGLEPRDFEDTINVRAKGRFRSLIEARERYRLTNRFVRFLIDDIEFEWASRKIRYPQLYFSRNGRALEGFRRNDLTSWYFDFVKDVDFANDYAISSTHYSAFMARYFAFRFMDWEAEKGSQNMSFGIGRYEMTKQELAGRHGYFLMAKWLASSIEFGDSEGMNHVLARIPEFIRNNPFPEYTETLNRLLKDSKSIGKGTQIPLFALPDLNDRDLSMQELLGNVVLINFWASWCSPCIGSIPYLDEIAAQTQERNFKILNVSLDKRPEQWKKTVRRFDIPGLHVRTGGFETPLPSYFQVRSLPAYLLVGKEGQILERLSGLERTQELIRKIESAL